RQKLLRGPDDYARYKLMVDSGYHFQQMRNTLQLNTGNTDDGRPLFSEIGQLARISSTDWSWAPLFVDLDNDGWKDLFITNGYLRDFTSMDFLKYTVEEERQKAYANGKKLNLYELVSKMSSTKVHDYVYRNKADLTFENVTHKWGFSQPNLSFGLTSADLDNDGDLEVITNGTNEEATIWVNHSREKYGNNFLRVMLKGDGQNKLVIGGRVSVYAGELHQTQELNLSRGYQSSIEPVLHFGLGKKSVVDSIVVWWPNHKSFTQIKPRINTQIAVRTDSARFSHYDSRVDELVYLTDYTNQSGVNWSHQENSFEDFDFEPMLMYRSSRLGPALAVGDLNKDGDDDFFVGGGAGQAGKLWISDSKHNFKETTHQPWEADAKCEDVGATFFDAEGDGDLDLFVVSGSSEFMKGAAELQDRLYLNDGFGQFSKSPVETIIAEGLNGSCVTAGDYDLDGDVDLYV
ncbi:MAG: VCBS repeat-containing protein, partial [Flammeovirgaceae bacterium]